MSILEMQRAFCDILTDDKAREAYLASPTTFLSTYDLDTRESRALTGVNALRLRIYARMLVYSRIELGLKAFPNAQKLLPPDFVERYGPRFGREFPRTVGHDMGPLAREFRYLSEFLKRLVEEGVIAHDVFLDVMHYDATRYTLANDSAIGVAIAEFERHSSTPADTESILKARVLRAPGAVLTEFRHDLIATSAEEVEFRAVRSPTPVLVLFQKNSKSRRVRAYRINALTSVFLELCDGRHTIPENARMIEDAGGGDHQHCVKLGLTLVARGVIGVIPESVATHAA